MNPEMNQLTEQIIGAAEDIAKALPDQIQLATFPTRRIEGSWGMVVRARGGNKGSALGWVADHYGVRLEETIAVGDWINDVPMFKVAGRSFAMGQAPEEVAAVATERTGTDLDDGVASTLARYFQD